MHPKAGPLSARLLLANWLAHDQLHVRQMLRVHREALLRQVQEGRLPDGRLDVAALSALPGRCGSCARWQGPDAYGDGLCSLGRAAHGWHDGNPRAPVLIVPHHKCAAHGGAGWKAKGRA